MHAALSYANTAPEQLSAALHPIAAVATSVTAFVGRALRGPVEEPVGIASFADFERQFGGLWGDSALGYAVRDFFLNGGGKAVIVRLYRAPAPLEGVVRSHAILRAGALTLRARDPGAWGNALQARVDHDLLSEDPHSFNLSVRDSVTGHVEVFRNVSVGASHPRRIDLVLRSVSRLVTVSGELPAERPRSNPRPAHGQGDAWESGAASNTRVNEAERAAAELPLTLADFIGSGKLAAKAGLYALARAELFNLLCIPPYLDNGGDLLDGGVDDALVAEAAAYCERRRAMLLVDPPPAWNSVDNAVEGVAALGTSSRNAALFFPRLLQPVEQRSGALTRLVPCGAVAGIIARTDHQRGVWKAPVGMDTTLVGVPGLSVPVSDSDSTMLNPLGINCLRSMPGAGRIVWGARTMHDEDADGAQCKGMPVRRTALFIEESLVRGTRWVMFEPNDDQLWTQIRLSIHAFMVGLFRQGAFQGKAPHEAFFVSCGPETTTQDDVEHGVVNITVGFAPLKAGQFVLVHVQQAAGQVRSH
ncbi:phage tail sheath subtilisin-like domain-containing protein [Massilia sp. P8910]|uniref:phage tail sheath family protein n=1 Tax=Massilia antarctica TaxID=2765360 RepID=UPI001E573E96|nr:phage tail sheath subtilisin-like domain-containing protein [Massilia antarctica]MCE3604863.1 phage tail sheath subtilisin-like domain-containing protein [Massilia antarctica]